MTVSYSFDFEKLPQEIIMSLAKIGITYLGTKKENGADVFLYDVPSYQAEEELAKILYSVDGKVKWMDLINQTSFDACFAARVIKENGLPESEQVRTLLLSRLRKTKKNELHVNYRDMCCYAESFYKVYGLDRLKDITSRIENGRIIYDKASNAIKAKNEGRITAEEAELILYAFPCISTPMRDKTLTDITFAEEIFGDD